MERENNVAGDLQEATTLIEKAFMLLIKYHKRDGRPLSYQERMRLETFLGSVEGIECCMQYYMCRGRLERDA
jgi:hypothetical protein